MDERKHDVDERRSDEDRVEEPEGGAQPPAGLLDGDEDGVVDEREDDTDQEVEAVPERLGADAVVDEGRREERTLASRKAVIARIALDERTLSKLPVDRPHGGLLTPVVGVTVAVEDAEQETRVELIAAGEADVTTLGGRPAFGLDERPDRG